MVVTKRNIYHPFVNRSFGFVITSKIGTHSEGFFTDVDLTWQPVQDPKVAIPLLVTNVILFLAGGFVHFHLWKMLQRGESLVSSILKAYVILQMICWPYHMIFASVTDFIYPLSEVLGTWTCVLSFFVMYPFGLFISFHTTIIAIMRYVFIVHDERIANFGKQRAKSLFYWILGIVPIVMTIWLYFGAVDRDFDGYPPMNKCTGSYHKIFFIKWSFAEPQPVWLARCGGHPKDSESLFVAITKFFQCRASSSLSVLLVSNVFDGFMYYRTWTHILKT